MTEPTIWPKLVNTPRGNEFTLCVREGTADWSLAAAILGGDEYRLAHIEHIEGTVLDAGAHIGIVALALLVDHPLVKVVAVEPVHENADLMMWSLLHNPEIDRSRLTIIEAAFGEGETADIGYGYTRATEGADKHAVDPSYVQDNRFIGGMWRDGSEHDGEVAHVPAYNLNTLCEHLGIDGFSVVKTDCEGGEYALFAKGAARAGLIFGEWHDGGPEKLAALLEPTHIFHVQEDHGGTGIFAAVPRFGPYGGAEA